MRRQVRHSGRVLVQLVEDMPCRYSTEERQERIRKSLEEKEKGDYVSQEEMKKRFTA